MSAVVITRHGDAALSGAGRGTGYEGGSSPRQRLGVAHYENAECGSSPARSSGLSFIPRQRGGGDWRLKPGHHLAPDFIGPFSSARNWFLSRIKLPGDLRNHAARCRSDSLELSCATAFHEQHGNTGAFANVQEIIGEIRNVER